MTHAEVIGNGLGTAADALEAYGKERLECCAERSQPGIESTLDIVATFCDEVAPALLDPLSRRRIERRAEGSATPARHLIDAGHLLRVLGPCVALFPFQIVAGLGVLEGFYGEMPRLARWLQRRGASAGRDEFDAAWNEARPLLLRHADVQRSVEEALLRSSQHDGEIVVGRFLIEREEPIGIWVRADADERGPVRIPRAIRPLFGAGQELSMAFRRGAVGWTPLAAALPCAPGGLEELLRTLADGRRPGN
jgi:hypothetical protein